MESGYYINKTFIRNEGVLKALLFNIPPSSFKDEKEELMGSIVEFFIWIL